MSGKWEQGKNDHQILLCVCVCVCVCGGSFFEVKTWLSLLLSTQQHYCIYVSQRGFKFLCRFQASEEKYPSVSTLLLLLIIIDFKKLIPGLPWWRSG